MSGKSRRRGAPNESGPPPRADQEVTLEGIYASALPTIVNSSDDGIVRLAAPRIAGVDIPLPLAQPFKISYRVLGVPSEVAAVLVEIGGGEYVAKLTGEPVRIQRRDQVRVPTRLQVMLRMPDGDEPGERYLANTMDLSTGGMLVSSDDAIDRDQHVFAALNCGDAGLLEMELTVVRCVRDLDSDTWRIAFRIVDMEPEHRKALSLYLLHRQRELRRRELGLD